jgi:hypothetical protein
LAETRWFGVRLSRRAAAVRPALSCHPGTLFFTDAGTQKGDDTMQKRVCVKLLILGMISLVPGLTAHSAVPDAMILNEANTVSGDKYLDATKNPTRADPTYGRVQGNGQNWLEFLVVQGDDKGGGAFSNTLDLRGWRLNWSYDKMDPTAPNNFGSGVIQFTNDPAWAAVPRGTILTISEWQDAWYSKTPDPNDTSTGLPGGTPRNGLPRVGGIDGLGVAKGDPYDPSIDYKLGAQPGLPGAGTDPHILSTDLSWNPAAPLSGDTGDWHMNVFAGQRNPDTSFKYFNFSGSVTNDGVTSAIGTEDGGLFVVNNDNWQITLNDGTNANGGQGNVIEGPLGESTSGYHISSVENLHFEDNTFSTTNPVKPTQADYLTVGNGNYKDGSTNTFGLPDKWSSGSFTQDVSALRSWVHFGDANLDGTVNAADYTLWRDHLGQAGDFRAGDFDGDGTVTMADYAIWKNNYGQTGGGAGAGASASVPEPATWLLMTLGGLALVGMRRSR